MKTKHFFLSVSFLFFILYSPLNAAQLKNKSWIGDLITSIDINAFVKSFKFDAKFKTCGHKLHDSLVGVVLHHTDLFLFSESVREKGWVVLFQSNILGKSKFSSLKSIMGTGTNRGTSGSQYVNIIELPILGMITKSLGLDGIACFHPSGKFFFYSSAIDPTGKDYMQYEMLLDEANMFTTNGILSMIVDCVASEAYAKMSNKQSKVAQFTSDTIDMYRYSWGCNGGITLGSTNQSAAPLVNGMIQALTTINILSRTGFVIMESKNSILTKGRNVGCTQLRGPMIKSEFAPQLLQPIASKQFELGQSPSEWASFKDNHTTGGDTVIAWWVRKDFVAYAGKCIW